MKFTKLASILRKIKVYILHSNTEITNLHAGDHPSGLNPTIQ